MAAAPVNPRASIDIGTNTVLLLIADVHENGIRPLDEAQLIPRLGRGVDADRRLSSAATGRVSEAVREHLGFIRQHYGDIPVIITATSAVRDATNREEVLEQWYQETGYQVQLLSGDEEAELTYFGALATVDPEDREHTVIDIGGGSTEIIHGSREAVKQAHSFDIGCVRFTERFLPHMPPSAESIASCKSTLREELRGGPATVAGRDGELLGVAGTITSLAALHQQLPGYDAKSINNYVLSRAEIEEFTQYFSDLDKQQIEALNPEVMSGRSDIMLAGLLILTGVMQFWNYSSLRVSIGGLRHGVLLRY